MGVCLCRTDTVNSQLIGRRCGSDIVECSAVVASLVVLVNGREVNNARHRVDVNPRVALQYVTVLHTSNDNWVRSTTTTSTNTTTDRNNAKVTWRRHFTIFINTCKNLQICMLQHAATEHNHMLTAEKSKNTQIHTHTWTWTAPSVRRIASCHR